MKSKQVLRENNEGSGERNDESLGWKGISGTVINQDNTSPHALAILVSL